ncbi:hypothetical protein BDV19DRAFT_391981 [Aspergillus venezuelensis]
MSFDKRLDLLLAQGHSAGPAIQTIGQSLPDMKNHPPHWMLIVGPKESKERCTFIHVTKTRDSPTYKPVISRNRPLATSGAAYKRHIGSIDENDMLLLLKLVEGVKPKGCQAYIQDLLGELEKRGMIDSSITEAYGKKVGPSVWSEIAWEGMNPDMTDEFVEKYRDLYLQSLEVPDMQWDSCFYSCREAEDGELEAVDLMDEPLDESVKEPVFIINRAYERLEQRSA